jgi:hypothetical protein
MYMLGTGNSSQDSTQKAAQQVPDWQIRDGQLMGGFQFIIQKAHSYPWTIVGIIFRKPHACSSHRGMLKTTFVDLKKK